MVCRKALVAQISRSCLIYVWRTYIDDDLNGGVQPTHQQEYEQLEEELVAEYER